MGEQFASLHQAKRNQERLSNLRRSRSSSSSSSWNAQGKGMILIGFLFYRSRGGVGRPGYKIDNITIKRGSRMSNLIVSFVESSNICILSIIFLGSYLTCIYVRFLSLSLSSIQAQVHQKLISYENLIAFLILEVLSVLLL